VGGKKVGHPGVQCGAAPRDEIEKFRPVVHARL
jgi:hypothetical protein